jgi:hypothetical protein
MSESNAEAAPKLKMVFRVRSWSIKSKVNRSGREDGEAITMTGHVYAPSIDPDTPLSNAWAVVKPKGAQDRMSVKIGKDETEISVPLEDFAMERTTAKIKEMSGDYGLALSIEFEANETTDRQLFDFAEFTFTKTESSPAPGRASASAPAAAKPPAGAPQMVTR